MATVSFPDRKSASHQMDEVGIDSVFSRTR